MNEIQVLILVQARAMKGNSSNAEWHTWLCHDDGSECLGVGCAVDSDLAIAYSKAFDGDDCECRTCEPVLFALRHSYRNAKPEGGYTM